MKFILILLLLTSCAKIGFHSQELTIQGFEKYIKLFEDYSCIYNEECIKVTNLIIKLEDLPTPKNGNCRIFSDGRTPEITFDTEYWLNASDIQREVLALHELGHFLGRKDHINELYSDNCPISIMYPSTLGSYCYKIHKQELLREYFE